MFTTDIEGKAVVFSGVTLAGIEATLLEKLPVSFLAPMTLLLFTSVAYLLKRDYAQVTKQVSDHSRELRLSGERLAVIESKLDLLLKGMVSAYEPKKTSGDKRGPQQDKLGGDGTDGTPGV